MWKYSEKVTDHFRNPRNVGAVENPDGDRVFVKFVGACVSCPVSAVTLKNVVENQLREAVSDSLVVEAV